MSVRKYVLINIETNEIVGWSDYIEPLMRTASKTSRYAGISMTYDDMRIMQLVETYG